MKPNSKTPKELAVIFDGLSNEKRVIIYQLLEAKGPMSYSNLQFDLIQELNKGKGPNDKKENVEQTTLNNHLLKMKNTGLIEEKGNTIRLIKKIDINVGDMKSK